jgi:hypothetical protein
MAKKGSAAKSVAPAIPASGRSSALLDTRVVYCGDNLEQLAKLPDPRLHKSGRYSPRGKPAGIIDRSQDEMLKTA